MRRYEQDYHHVDRAHSHIHARLLNWARWVKPGTVSSVSPMFRQYRAPWWQWHTPQHRETCDILDAQLVEKQMRHLSDTARVAGVWSYVYPFIPPGKVCAHLGLRHKDLAEQVRMFRTMVASLLEGPETGL